jgi:hypothetical protein
MQAQAESALPGSTAKTAALPSLTAEVPTSTSISPRTQPDKPAVVATQSPLVNEPAAIAAWVTVTTPLQVAPESIAIVSTIGQPGWALSSNHSTSSEHGAKHKAAPTSGDRPLVIATAGSAPQAIAPAQSTGVPVESAAQPAPSLPPASLAIAVPTAPLPTAPIFDSFNPNSQHVADREALADSFSPAAIQTSTVEREVGMAHGLPPVAFNEAVTSTTGAEVHAPSIATSSPVARSSPQYDLHVSAGKATVAASPVPLEDTGTQTAGLSLAHSTGFDSNQSVQGATQAGLHAPHIAAGSPDVHSSPQYDLHVSADKATQAVSPVEDTGTQTAGLSLAHPAGFDSNPAAQGAAAAGLHAPNIGTGSPVARSSPQYDLHVSADKATEAVSPVEDTGTQTAVLSLAHPAGFDSSQSVQGATQAGLHAPHIAAGSPDARSSPQCDLHVSADKATEAASPVEDLGTQTAGLSLAHPAGLGTIPAVQSATEAELHSPNVATGSRVARSSPQYDLHVSADKTTEAASAVEDTGTQTAGLSLAHSTAFDSNPAVQGAAEAGLHEPHIVTGSPDARSSPQYDLHVSADKATEAATDKGSPQPGVATRAREVHSAIPVDSIGPAEVTGKASDLVEYVAGAAVATAPDPDSRTSTAGPGFTPARQIAFGTGRPAPPAKTSLNPSTSPSVPSRTASASEPAGPANLTPSSGTQLPTVDDPPQSPSPMRPQAEESPESSSQAGIPIQPRPGSQEVETVAAPIAVDWLERTSTLQAAAPLRSVQVAPMPPVVGKPGLATDEGAQPRARSPRAARAVDTVTPVGDQPAGQTASRVMDSTPQTRDLAAANLPASLTGGASRASAGSTASPAARETFAVLDGETVNASPTWIHTGTQRAEAGFHDPALGWIGVRADSASGGVHASLVPDSADAAQALGGHMAGLNAYLIEQHTPVQTLTVAAPESRSVGSSTDQTGSQGMHQGAGQDSGQGSYSETLSHAPQGTTAVTEAASSIEAAPDGRPEASAPAIGLGGSHISVMA